MRKLLLVLALMAPSISAASEEFISKVGFPIVDQFTASALLEEGQCIAGVPFVLEKTGFKKLPAKVEKRLEELGANAWVLLEYEEGFGLLVGKVVDAVHVLPLRCDLPTGTTEDRVKT